MDENSLVLPSLLDLTAAEPLCRALIERLLAADTIVIDGTAVERISTASIQVLLAAATEARSRGVLLQLRQPSPPLAAALADLGLSADLGC